MSAAANSDTESWLRLALVKGLTNAGLRKLLAEYGPPEQVMGARHAEVSRFVPNDVASAVVSGGNAEGAQHALAWLADSSNHVVTLGDSDYPQLLLQSVDPPPVLYVKGRLDLLNHSALAIVGSRNATVQGMNNATEFAHALSDGGLTIVSGLALGIDAAAHRGGLAGSSSSLAVVGTGLDVVYPARNRALAHELAERGVLISEFPLGTPAINTNFPRRNRIISGISLGCLVVEAALQSGSLITARLANEQGREVFALPGSIHSALAKGCHRLIKQGAKLVDSANDILEELKLAPTAAGHTLAPPALEASARQLLTALGYEPCSLETLCERTGRSTEAITSALLMLELEGLIENLPGGRYQRTR